MTDPLQIVADLKPAVLDEQAQEAHQRRRASDLARAFAEPSVATRRRHWPLVTGAGLLSAAAGFTAIALTGALAGSPAGHPAQHPPVGGGPSSPAVTTLDARTFLLTSAAIVGRAPATTGAFWYVKERDFEPTWPQLTSGGSGVSAKKGLRKSAKPAAPSYTAYYAATEESWTGPATARTIVNEGLQFGFADAKAQAAWVAAGKPKLFNPAGAYGYTGPRTSNYSMTFYFGYGVHRMSVTQARKLPGTTDALRKVLMQMWNTETDKQGAVGASHPNFGQYVFTWAGALLGGPASPATKAALYRILAAQPGITVTGGVTDPLGRTGVAIGDGTGDHLLMDPSTATLLDTTTAPVHAGGKIQAALGGTEAILGQGWTSGPGIPARS